MIRADPRLFAPIRTYPGFELPSCRAEARTGHCPVRVGLRPAASHCELLRVNSTLRPRPTQTPVEGHGGPRNVWSPYPVHHHPIAPPISTQLHPSPPKVL